MNVYQMLSSYKQCDRLKKLLEYRGEKGVTISEISNSLPNGLGIKRYGARIYDLRKRHGVQVEILSNGVYRLLGGQA